MSLFDVVGPVSDDTHPSTKFFLRSPGLALEGPDSPDHCWCVVLVFVWYVDNVIHSITVGTVGTVGHLSELSDCRTSRLTVYDSDGACSQSDLLSELSESCRTPVGLSDCRTVGLSDYCRTTVGIHCRTVGPGLSDSIANRIELGYRVLST